jgi:hypothetical protein
MLPTKFWFMWTGGYRGEDSNLKRLQTDDGCQVMTKAHMALTWSLCQYTTLVHQRLFSSSITDYRLTHLIYLTLWVRVRVRVNPLPFYRLAKNVNYWQHIYTFNFFLIKNQNVNLIIEGLFLNSFKLIFLQVKMLIN